MKEAALGVGLLVTFLNGGLARAADPPKRPVPDYDGRGGRRETPARKALWVPRILLSPAYFVSEFLVRRPLGATITAAEKARVPRLLYDFFLFGPDHKAGVVPLTLIDFGFEPSVGLYAFWDDAGFEGHELRLHGSTWGARWLSITATERFHFSDRLDVTLTSTATRRPDYAFCGIGPDSRETELMRYSADTVDSRAQSNLSFAGSSLLQTSVGYRGASFGHSDYDADNRGTVSYQLRMSPFRSRAIKAARCMSSVEQTSTVSWQRSWGPFGLATPSTTRHIRSTLPSCSLRRASSCRPHCWHWIAEAPWRSRASTFRTYLP